MKGFFDRTTIVILFFMAVICALSLLPLPQPVVCAAAVFLCGCLLVVHHRLPKKQRKNNNIRSVLYDKGGEGVIVFDDTLCCVDINDRAKSLLELEAEEEYLGLEAADLLGSEGLSGQNDNGLQLIEKVLVTGEKQSFYDGWFQNERIKKFPVEFSSHPFKDGKKTGVVVIFRDVSAERRVGALLKEKINLLDALETNGDIGFWEWDVDYSEFSMSAQFKKLLDIRLTEPVVEDIFLSRYIHPDDKDAVRRKVRQVLDNQQEFDLTCRMGASEDKMRAIRSFGRITCNKDGSGKKMIGFSYAVSTTEESGHNSTKAVTLRFLTGMSHDLRTPLNSILGFAQLLSQKDSSIDPESVQNGQQILQSGRHLLQLISDIIDYAKIEAGQLQINVEQVPLGTVAQETIDITGTLAAQKGVRIDYDQTVTGQDIWVFVDRNRLRQVLINVISHVIQFGHGGGNVKVELEELSADNIQVNVLDLDQAIPMGKVLPIFDEGEELENGTTKMQEMELLLAVSKRLVEQMNGRLTLTSHPDGYNVFKLMLPRCEPFEVQSLDEPVSAVEQSGEEGEPLDVSFRQYTIINIEDNPANRQLVKSVLKRYENYTLLEAENGTDGLAMVKEKMPDCVLMDIHLPDMTGYEVLENLKNDPLTSIIPVIALSGQASDTDKQKGFDAGFVDYIGKPLHVAEFRDAVEKVLEGKE